MQSENTSNWLSGDGWRVPLVYKDLWCHWMSRPRRYCCSTCSFKNAKLGLLSSIALLIRYVCDVGICCACRRTLSLYACELARATEVGTGGGGVVALYAIQVRDLSVSFCRCRSLESTWVCSTAPRQLSFSKISLKGSSAETWIAPLAEVLPCTWILVTSFLKSCWRSNEGVNEATPANKKKEKKNRVVYAN